MQARQGTYGAVIIELDQVRFTRQRANQIGENGLLLKDINEAYELRDCLIDFLSGKDKNGPRPKAKPLAGG